MLCVLILYAGIYGGNRRNKEEIFSGINKILLEKAGQMYLTGFYYTETESPESIKEWIAKQAMKTIPLGEYLENTESNMGNVEDRETYEMILAKQANDESYINEKGDLVNETKQPILSEDTLLSDYYTVDSSTSVDDTLLNLDEMLTKNLTLNEEKGPKVLIYHTHSQEAFADSPKGDTSSTIMGMGKYLADLLNERYQIETIHHEGVYDLIDGKLDRSQAYQLAEPQIQKILKENPSIEVVIDLHRDGVKESTHLATQINGKPTAKVMFFNGLSRTRANGEISYLKNPYIKDNLAFSFQMQMKAAEKYPGFTRRIYLKAYRYNMHLMPKTLLIEAGAQTNTVEEMKNAMVVLADILDSVLKP